MTIQEAIATVQDLKPNQFKQQHFLKWLSEVDGIIQKEVINTHEKEQDFEGYEGHTDMSTQLLAPDPYSVLYIDYMCAMIDFYCGEFTRYNNSMVKYNNSYQTFVDYWNRENMSTKRHYVRL